MNKFLQWLQSIPSRLTGTFSSGKNLPPVIPREDPDARRERIIKNVISGFAEPGAQPQVADTHDNYTQAVLDGKASGLIPKAVDIPPVVDDHTGLGPTAAKRVATMPDLKSKMKITQSGLDQEIADLAQGDLKAAAALRMMAVMAPAYGDLDPNGPLSVFDLVRQAGLSGKEIGTFYEMCHSHPVKALGVLYAKEHLGLYRNYPLKGQVAAYGSPNAQPFRVNHIVDQAEWTISSANSLAMIQGVKPAKAMAPYKLDDLVEDVKSGNWEGIESQARAGNVRVSVEPINPERRFDGNGYVMSMTRMADGDPAITNMLMGLVAASQKVDPTNLEAHSAPLKALDEAGILRQRHRWPLPDLWSPSRQSGGPSTRHDLGLG